MKEKELEKEKTEKAVSEQKETAILTVAPERTFWEKATIPHKERTAKRSEKRYNKEVKKQLTMSLINDELGAGINEEEQRDPEAHSVKKGNQWYFGYKEHIGVDADSGLVHTVETTAANRRIVWTSILFSPRSRITRLIWIMLLP